MSNKDPPAYNTSFTDMFVERKSIFLLLCVLFLIIINNIAFVGEIGDTVDNPGVSCKDIYRKRGDMGLGIFYISIRRTVFPVLCDSSIFPGQGII